MTKADFLRILGEAYDFPDYYSHNLDSADEILSDLLEEKSEDKLSLRPLLAKLLNAATEQEREGVLDLLEEYFEW